MAGEAGFGYTLASGRLFCNLSDFHRWIEEIDGGPILTHELADKATWERLRRKFEQRVLAEIDSGDDEGIHGMDAA